MPRKPERNLLVGLDIGTSKVVAIVGELTVDGTIDVVGVPIMVVWTETGTPLTVILSASLPRASGWMASPNKSFP